MKSSRSRHPEGTQWHHLVPRQIYKGKLTRLTAEDREAFREARAFLVEHGFDQGYTDKVGLHLPDGDPDSVQYNTVREPHRGFTREHAQYNKDVVNAILRTKREASRNQYSFQQTQQTIRDTVESFRQEFRRGIRQLAEKAQRETQVEMFHETLQHTHLTESYNGNHPEHPVQARGATGGSIGGGGN